MALPDPRAFIEERIRQGSSTLRNVAELAAGSDPPINPTPRTLRWREGRASLWRYGPPDAGPPVLVVHSLVSRAFILDLMPGNTVMGSMLERGLQPWLLEWGVPDARDADNTLTTYADHYLPSAAAVVRDETGRDELVYLGYCFGANLLQLALPNRANDLRPAGLATLAAPIDFHEMGLLVDVVRGPEVDPEDLLDATGNMPTEPLERAFRVLQPTNQLSSWVDLLANIDDEQWLAGYRAMKHWIDHQVPFPGGVLVQVVPELFEPNALVGDGIELAGVHRRLEAIDCPVLVVAAEQDHVVPIAAAVPDGVAYGDPMTVLRPDAGHVGLVAGRQAARRTIPAILDWLEERAAAG